MSNAEAQINDLAEDMPQPALCRLATGRLAAFTTRCPGKDTPNEDCIALYEADMRRAAIVVADGFGGQPAGDRASRLAAGAVVEATESTLNAGGEMRTGILAGFDRANEQVRALGVGAATTLVVIEIDGPTIRPYHVGDSEALVVGQRGRVKLHTIAHSPVGYGVEAGMLDQNEAMNHKERHFVSNMVGAEDMRIDVGPVIRLRRRDTLLVASDGLFDNLMLDEIIETIRKGDLLESTQALVRQCHDRMSGAAAGPSKPDDLTVVAYRLAALGSRK